MSNEHARALRQQYQAPDLADCPPEILAYIDRLEKGIIDLARIRSELYDELAHWRTEASNLPGLEL